MSATVTAIKEMADLKALVGESVELHQQGHRSTGKCPFHADGTASLTIDERKGLWKCFGAGCGKGGDVFTWIMEREHCDFPEAVRYLAIRYGISIPSWTPEQQAEADLTRQVEKLLCEVAAACRLAYDGSPGQEYLRHRGITDGVAAAWNVGWAASPSFLAAITDLYPEAVVALAGVSPKSLSGKPATPGMFQHRVLVPLVRSGRTVNLYGRSAKVRVAYRSDAECNADKHRYLAGRPRFPFGLDEAGEQTVLTEGPLDAMSVQVAGYRAVSLGGAPSEEQRDMLLRWTEGPLLIGFDGDPDADKGPLMALKLVHLLSQGPNGRLCRVVDWSPSGVKDPSAILERDGPEAVAELIRAAQPPLFYRRAKGLETKYASSLLTQDGSNLKMEAPERRLYVVETIDNQSDPKGIRAGIRLLRGGDTLNVDNINLMSSIARKRFVTAAVKTMLRLEQSADKAALTGSLEEEILLLEQEVRYWDTETHDRETEEQDDTPLPMTDAERAEALAFLQNPYMLEETIKDVHALGVVGEEEGALMTWLTMTSRLMGDPFALIYKGESSVGKSFLLNTVAELCPPEDVRSFSRITPQALFYTEDPANFLKHKFLIISEMPGGEGADYSIRLMISEKGLSMMSTEKEGDKLVSRNRVIEGPLAFAQTTTAIEINNENETRLLEVYLNSGQDQTEHIHTRQRWQYTLAGRLHEADRQAIMLKHQNAQRLLRPLEVVLPFAEALTFPAMKPRTRRDQPKFLNMVCVVAFAHQYRKEVKVMQRGAATIEYVEANLEDYAVAYELARTLFAVSMDELDKRARELFALILEMVTAKWYDKHPPVAADPNLLGEEEPAAPAEPTPPELMGLAFTRRELVTWAKWSGHSVHAALDNLVENELLRTPGGRPGQTFVYYIQFIPNSSMGGELDKSLVSPAELTNLLIRKAQQTEGGEAVGP
jgi:DNA primase catalytic core